MFTVDSYLDRRFSRNSYNCWDFVRDVWRDLRGVELPKDQAQEYCWRIEKPVSPCLVLLQGVGEMPHVGVYYEGKVLHLRPRGVRYEELDMARVGFHTVTFYKVL